MYYPMYLCVFAGLFYRREEIEFSGIEEVAPVLLLPEEMLDDLEDDPERRMAGSIPARPCAIRRAAAAI